MIVLKILLALAAFLVSIGSFREAVRLTKSKNWDYVAVYIILGLLFTILGYITIKL